MVIKTIKGYYKILVNIKDAFNKEEFERKYLDEHFNEDGYILGDISSSMLRLKGFKKSDDVKKSLEIIDKYIVNDCAFHCPYYILHRISEVEYISTYKSEQSKEPYGTDLDIDKVYDNDKVPFDYDSLILESNPCVEPNVVLNMNRINKVVTFSLPDDLKKLGNGKGKKNSHSNRNESTKRDSNSIKSNEAKKERSKRASDKNSKNKNTTKNKNKNKQKNNVANQNNPNNVNSQKQNGNVQNENKPKKHKKYKKQGQKKPNNNPNANNQNKGNKPSHKVVEQGNKAKKPNNGQIKKPVIKQNDNKDKKPIPKKVNKGEKQNDTRRNNS